MGIKYMYSDYVIFGWQSDDLPLFGRIEDIVVVDNRAVLLRAQQFFTVGIDRHYHSFSIQRSNKEVIVSLTELVDYHTFKAHKIKDSLLLTLRSHVQRCF